MVTMVVRKLIFYIGRRNKRPCELIDKNKITFAECQIKWVPCDFRVKANFLIFL